MVEPTMKLMDWYHKAIEGADVYGLVLGLHLELVAGSLINQV